MRPEILSYFCTMKDPRMDRKKSHPLKNIILIFIAAVICGAETWDEIEDFGYVKFDWLSSASEESTSMKIYSLKHFLLMNKQ